MTTKPKELGRVLEVEVARKMRKMLKSVVTDGEFKWFVKQAGLEDFDLAGKTGTAQIPEGGRYNPDKTQVTFAGFAPSEDPQFVLLVKLNQPSTSTYSADTAVPLWLKMVREVLVNYHITPH